jgi:hypothetical protein
MLTNMNKYKKKVTYQNMRLTGYEEEGVLVTSSQFLNAEEAFFQQFESDLKDIKPDITKSDAKYYKNMIEKIPNYAKHSHLLYAAAVILKYLENVYKIKKNDPKIHLKRKKIFYTDKEGFGLLEKVMTTHTKDNDTDFKKLEADIIRYYRSLFE